MPAIRTDIVDVYVFRKPGASDGSAEFLQLRRAGATLAGTWQPVMGHVAQSETAVVAALRELKEETGYAPGHGLSAFWQLETVNTYFLASRDCVMMSPCFAALVGAGTEPALNGEHDSARWVRRDHVDRFFLWPGQRSAIEQIVRDLLPSVTGAPTAAGSLLRIDVPGI